MTVQNDSDNSNNMVIFLMSPPKCIHPLEFTALSFSYKSHIKPLINSVTQVTDFEV